MKCEKCGIEYEGEFCPQCSTQAQQEKPKKQKKPVVKKWWFWVLMGLATVITIGIVTGGGEDLEAPSLNTGNTNSSVKITYEKVDLQTMMDELKNNAMKAEANYQDKYVEVTGKIANFDSDGKYISIEPVTASEWNIVDRAMCYIKTDEQKQFLLEKAEGDTVTIKGKVKSIGEVIGYSIDIAEIN